MMLRLILSIVWPSFLVSIIAEGFFFSVFVLQDLQLAVGCLFVLLVFGVFFVVFLFLRIRSAGSAARGRQQDRAVGNRCLYRRVLFFLGLLLDRQHADLLLDACARRPAAAVLAGC